MKKVTALSFLFIAALALSACLPGSSQPAEDEVMDGGSEVNFIEPAQPEEPAMEGEAGGAEVMMENEAVIEE